MCILLSQSSARVDSLRRSSCQPVSNDPPLLTSPKSRTHPGKSPTRTNIDIGPESLKESLPPVSPRSHGYDSTLNFPPAALISPHLGPERLTHYWGGGQIWKKACIKMARSSCSGVLSVGYGVSPGPTKRVVSGITCLSFGLQYKVLISCFHQELGMVPLP